MVAGGPTSGKGPGAVGTKVYADFTDSDPPWGFQLRAWALSLLGVRLEYGKPGFPPYGHAILSCPY